MSTPTKPNRTICIISYIRTCNGNANTRRIPNGDYNAHCRLCSDPGFSLHSDSLEWLENEARRHHEAVIAGTKYIPSPPAPPATHNLDPYDGSDLWEMFKRKLGKLKGPLQKQQSTNEIFQTLP